MIDKERLTTELKSELTGNLLPFWIRHSVDPENGGFYGAVTNDLQVKNEVPRSAILCGRILWTFSAAYRELGGEENLAMARRAFDYLTAVFWDPEFGGVYFEVDQKGRPVFDHKHHYAQGFALYGLAEYYRATQDPLSLRLSQSLFDLLEQHAFEPAHGGYIEGSSRKWEKLADMRLSEIDLNCRKSMNTNLHILEAYTNLLRIWDDPRLRRQHQALIRTFRERVFDPETNHLRLFFDDDWTSLSEIRSYGHDIEGSWLLWEAAEVQGDSALTEGIRGPVVALAEAVYREALEKDGSIVYEGSPHGLVNGGKAWWAQAEAMVGFYNAYQLTREEKFAAASARLWEYIQARCVDREHGEWFKQLQRDGTPDLEHYKIGPWDCPYHSARACFEMLARLKK